MKNKELKTLKDLKSQKGSVTEGYVSEYKLKAEAIKHIKAVEKGDLSYNLRSYIMWANNITEEDLK